MIKVSEDLLEAAHKKLSKYALKLREGNATPAMKKELIEVEALKVEIEKYLPSFNQN